MNDEARSDEASAPISADLTIQIWAAAQTIQVLATARLEVTSTSIIDGAWHRRGRWRAGRHHVVSLAGRPVGEVVTIEGGEYHGLVAWVTLAPEYRGRGLGVEIHRATAASLGAPLLIDTCGERETEDRGETYSYANHVCDAEMRVVDALLRRPAWYLRFRADGLVVADAVTP